MNFLSAMTEMIKNSSDEILVKLADKLTLNKDNLEFARIIAKEIDIRDGGVCKLSYDIHNFEKGLKENSLIWTSPSTAELNSFVSRCSNEFSKGGK